MLTLFTSNIAQFYLAYFIFLIIILFIKLKFLYGEGKTAHIHCQFSFALGKTNDDTTSRMYYQRVSNFDWLFFPLGESNVYTLGNIGAHRIVSTKLPSVGSTREAMTATGNTTTRLLGTFQKVDFVFIVGVAGGIPHYTDFKKHVRLGDVVISHVDQNRMFNG